MTFLALYKILCLAFVPFWMAFVPPPNFDFTKAKMALPLLERISKPVNGE